VAYCLQTGTWSTPVYNTDAGVTGSWVSGINARGELVITLTNGGTQTAYSFDNNTATTRIPTVTISQWQPTTLGRSVNIYEGDIALSGGTNVEAVIIGFHSNLFTTHLRGCSVSSGSATLTTPSGLTTLYTGMRAAVFGTDIGGVGVNYLIVKLTYASSTTATMSNPSTGASVTAQATASNCLVLIGRDFFAVTPVASSFQHVLNVRPAIQNVRSYCMSIYQATNAATGQVFSSSLYGTGSESSLVNVV